MPPLRHGDETSYSLTPPNRKRRDTDQHSYAPTPPPKDVPGSYPQINETPSSSALKGIFSGFSNWFDKASKSAENDLKFIKKHFKRSHPYTRSLNHKNKNHENSIQVTTILESNREESPPIPKITVANMVKTIERVFPTDIAVAPSHFYKSLPPPPAGTMRNFEQSSNENFNKKYIDLETEIKLLKSQMNQQNVLMKSMRSLMTNMEVNLRDLQKFKDQMNISHNYQIENSFNPSIQQELSTNISEEISSNNHDQISNFQSINKFPNIIPSPPPLSRSVNYNDLPASIRRSPSKLSRKKNSISLIASMATSKNNTPLQKSSIRNVLSEIKTGIRLRQIHLNNRSPGRTLLKNQNHINEKSSTVYVDKENVKTNSNDIFNRKSIHERHQVTLQDNNAAQYSDSDI